MKPDFQKKKISSLIIRENVQKTMVFRVSSQNYSKDFFQIAYVNRGWCILSNKKPQVQENSPSSYFAYWRR